MVNLSQLFQEWKDPASRRPAIDIARDILALAGEQRPGQVILSEDLVDNPIIAEIARRSIFANKFLQGAYCNPVSPGVVVDGANRPLFCEDIRMARRASDIAWANLPLPC